MQSVLNSRSRPPISFSASPQAGHETEMSLGCIVFQLQILPEAHPRARQAAHRDMKQQHPAQPVHALIEHAVIRDALDQRKVRVVPHAPVARERAAEVQDEKRRRREHTGDRAHQRRGRAAASGQKQRHDRQHVYREIQHPERERNGVAPVERLTDVIPVVDQYGDDHDDRAGGDGFDDGCVELAVEQLHRFFLSFRHSDPPKQILPRGQY